MGEEVKLTRRAKEVAGLVALGLTNREIAARLFLSERTIEWHLEQILNKLGFSSRSQIAAWVGRTQLDIVLAEPATGRRGNLPAQITSFVGRDQDLRALLDLISSHRLVTVTGAGGTGKTRLALRLGEELQADYPNGIWLCDLAPVADQELVADVVAQALGVKGRDTDLAGALRAHLRDRSAMLVMDNCEHVLASSAALAADLLAACPSVRILSTSRIPLGVIGEAVWQLKPMPHAEAVRLFLERAAAAVPGFPTHGGSNAAIDAICHQLDELPLAIELAAPRLRVQSAAELADALLDPAWRHQSSIGRHSSLDAVADWSYRLMSPPDQGLFRRLGIFAGWFDGDDAIAVAPDSGAPVPVVLGSLVEQSMLVLNSADGSARYRLLDVLKRFALERLGESGELERARALHAEHLVALVPPIDSFPPDGPSRRAKVMSTMVDDARAALRHLISTAPRRAAWLSASMMPGWSLSGRIREGLRWSELTLKASSEPSSERCLNLFMHVTGLGELRRLSEATAFLAEAESFADAPGNEDVQRQTLIARATCYDMIGEVDKAISYRARAIEQLEKSGDESTLAVALNHNGMSLLFAGHPEAAATFARRSIDIERRLSSGRVAYPLDTLAQAMAMSGHLREASACWLEALQLCVDTWDAAVVSEVLFGLALVAGLDHRAEDALRLYYLADRLQTELEAPYWAPITGTLLELIDLVESEVGHEARERVRSESASLTPQMVLAGSVSRARVS